MEEEGEGATMEKVEDQADIILGLVGRVKAIDDGTRQRKDR